jgi:hypothetical protein
VGCGHDAAKPARPISVTRPNTPAATVWRLSEFVMRAMLACLVLYKKQKVLKFVYEQRFGTHC